MESLPHETIVIITDKKSVKFYHFLKIEGETVVIYPLTDVIDLTESCDPEVLIIDCGSDTKSGLRLLHDLKAWRIDLPVFFLTDKSSEEIVLEAIRLGAREFIKKPVNLLSLQSKIEKLLALKRRGKEKRKNLIEPDNKGVDN